MIGRYSLVTFRKAPAEGFREGRVIRPSNLAGSDWLVQWSESNIATYERERDLRVVELPAVLTRRGPQRAATPFAKGKARTA